LLATETIDASFHRCQEKTRGYAREKLNLL
jgi:hypothetical protein